MDDKYRCPKFKCMLNFDILHVHVKLKMTVIQIVCMHEQCEVKRCSRFNKLFKMISFMILFILANSTQKLYFNSFLVSIRFNIFVIISWMLIALNTVTKVVSSSEEKLWGGNHITFLFHYIEFKKQNFLSQADLLRDNWKDCSRDYTSQCHVHRVREPDVWQCSAGRWRDVRISYCWIHQYVPGNSSFSVSFLCDRSNLFVCL